MISTYAENTTGTYAIEHKRPDGGNCTNIYRNYYHTGFSHSRGIAVHRLSDGRDCTVSRLIYKHTVTCASCNGIIYTNADGECTEEHSACTTHIVNEPYIGAK